MFKQKIKSDPGEPPLPKIGEQFSADVKGAEGSLDVECVGYSDDGMPVVQIMPASEFEVRPNAQGTWCVNLELGEYIDDLYRTPDPDSEEDKDDAGQMDSDR